MPVGRSPAYSDVSACFSFRRRSLLIIPRHGRVAATGVRETRSHQAPDPAYPYVTELDTGGSFLV